MFSIKSLASVLAVVGLSSAAAVHHQKRADDSITLFVYGSDVIGPPVYYVDGLAYFGKTTLDESTGTQTNITFATSDDTTTPWSITANSTIVSFNETNYLYIIPSSGGFEQVGFSTNSSLPTGAVNEGFAWFGKSVAYAASSSDYQLMFYGLATNTTGVYGLYWNAGTLTDGAFPVAVKSTPPTFT